MDDHKEYQIDIEPFRSVFLKYTRKAFEMLPKMDKPKILDIGCGSGLQTIELARLSNGQITGFDINQEALNKLIEKIKAQNLGARIKTENLSLYETGLSSIGFDILWEEGVIHLLDIERALKECYRLLKPNGYLISFETIKWMEKNLVNFAKQHLELVNHFLLPEGAWWTEYYEPLEREIAGLRAKFRTPEALEFYKPYQNEIATVKKAIHDTDCGFYIFQKIK